MIEASAPGRRAGGARRTGAISKLLFSLALIASTASLPAFAGSSSRGETRTFSAYQVDFDSGLVGITIHGHASTEIVEITEANLPSDIHVRYFERGGILHVVAQYVGNSKGSTALLGKARLVASMPRFEFVHIQTTSGPVSVDNLSTNHLDVHTQTGGIEITDTNASLHVGSTAGNQHYRQIYGSIDASSTTGDLSIDRTWGVMKVSTKSGSVKAQDVNIAGSSSFRADTGSIDVGLTYGLSRYRYVFDLHSGGGKIRLGSIVRTGNLRWGEGNIRISATTTSGTQNFH